METHSKKLEKKITNRMVVCGKHFQPSDFFARGEGPLFRTKLKRNAVPSLNLPISSCENPEKLNQKKQNSFLRLERINRREKSKEEYKSPCQSCNLLDDLFEDSEDDSRDIALAAEALMTMSRKKKRDASSQVMSNDLVFHEDKASVSTQVTSGDLIVPRSFIDKMTERGLNSLTGLHSFSLLNTLVALLQKDYGKTIRSHKMPLKDQIILTLMRLKLDITFAALSVFFECSNSTCKNIFTDIIKYLAVHLKCAVQWLPKEVIVQQMPQCFNAYKSTRVVLDCTEVQVTKPNCAKCKIMTYSQYKTDHTIKVMIGIAPNGLITFISPVFGGRASDKHIFEASGIVEYLEPHEDSIMVDKGFLVDEICKEHFINVIRPPFLRHKQQFSFEEAQTNTQVARARVHVERMIQRVKIFKIFNGRLPWGLLPHITNIFVVCSGLANLGSPLLSDDKF